MREGEKEYDAKLVTPLSALIWSHGCWVEMDGSLCSKRFFTVYFQSYVDDQLISTNMIKNAVIAGHDGNIWASSSGFNVSPTFTSFLPPLVSKSAKY